MSIGFIFPLNPILPLDRRSISVFGTVVCFLTRTFLFTKAPAFNVQSEIDFSVLLLLAAIMAVNFIIVNLVEAKHAIRYMQVAIQEEPVKGFWYVSLASLIAAPFLTNDGVILLMVEPILHAFHPTAADESLEENVVPSHATHSQSKLEPSDAMYFFLVLNCSANIGSALTYTGNPQNMIVSRESKDEFSASLMIYLFRFHKTR